jgi:predicted translin family RNA/ssDNA-binding protein
MRHARLLPLAAAALIAAGCGDEASDVAERGTTAAEQARQDLSPEAQEILDRSENVVADIAQTARGTAAGEISGDEAQKRLDSAAQDAGELADQAQDLPESDTARDRLVNLTADLERTAGELQAEAQQGQLDQADEAIAALRDSAQDTYRALGQNLTEDTRRQLEDAVKGLGD